MFGGIYPMNIWEKQMIHLDDEILTASKLAILIQNLCCEYRKQRRVNDTSFRHHGDSMLKYTQKHFCRMHGIS